MRGSAVVPPHPPTASRRTPPSPSRGEGLASAIALAFPDRLSRRRDGGGEQWQSVGGRGFRLDPTSPLARSEWLAVAEVAGAASGARILSAAAIGVDEIEALFADDIQPYTEVRFDPATAAISATRGRRLGAIKLSSAPDPRPDQAAIEAGLLEAVRRHGLGILPWSDATLSLRQRAAFAAHHDETVPGISDPALMARIDEWLAPLLHGKRRLDAVGSTALHNAVQGLLGYDAGRAVDRLAPSQFLSPAGSSHPIDYSAARRSDGRGPRPGALWPQGSSDGRGGASTLDPGDHLACPSADPDHQRPAGVLGRELAGRRQGNARTISQASLARRPRHRRADAQDQARKLLIPAPACANRGP